MGIFVVQLKYIYIYMACLKDVLQLLKDMFSEIGLFDLVL